jgi:hypothetical protein
MFTVLLILTGLLANYAMYILFKSTEALQGKLDGERDSMNSNETADPAAARGGAAAAAAGGAAGGGVAPTAAAAAAAVRIRLCFASKGAKWCALETAPDEPRSKASERGARTTTSPRAAFWCEGE